MPETRSDLKRGRVLVAGATGFLGYRVVRALLDEGAEVTALVRPTAEEKLGPLRSRVRLVSGDVWNPASLRGRARGHNVVIQLVGGLKPDPRRGLTYRHLNFVSARNVIQMAVNDGVPHLILASVVGVPFASPREYVESKREAERHLQKSGLAWTIVRMPPLFAPGEARSPLALLTELLSHVPILGGLLLPGAAMPVDTAARGIASLALMVQTGQRQMIRPQTLRRLGRTAERRLFRAESLSFEDEDPGLSEEPPFGWLPSRSLGADRD